MPKIFISYCHRQNQWVRECLEPCLTAGGAEVLIDHQRFKAGVTVIGQMDAVQNQADKHVLVLSQEYLNSLYCTHEMQRAIALDPNFQKGTTIPVVYSDCTLPPEITGPNPLCVDLRDDKQPAQWDLLLKQCKADLGTTAPAWLEARDEIVRFLSRGQSVNLVVGGAVKWRALLDHLKRDHIPELAIVNLESGATASRRGLVATILEALGVRSQVPKEPDDLGEFERVLSGRTMSHVALTHFDMADDRRRKYGVDLFASLRFLVSDARKLTLLVQSRTPLDALLPREHPLSPMAAIVKTVELR